MNNLLNCLKKPAQFIPAQFLNNPQAAVQQLMNSGRMSQQQFNYFRQIADNVQKSPMFTQMFGKRG